MTIVLYTHTIVEVISHSTLLGLYGLLLEFIKVHKRGSCRNLHTKSYGFHRSWYGMGLDSFHFYLNEAMRKSMNSKTPPLTLALSIVSFRAT